MSRTRATIPSTIVGFASYGSSSSAQSRSRSHHNFLQHCSSLWGCYGNIQAPIICLCIISTVKPGAIRRNRPWDRDITFGSHALNPNTLRTRYFCKGRGMIKREVQEATNSRPSNRGVQLEGKTKRTIIKPACVIVAELARRKSTRSWLSRIRGQQ